MEVSLPNCDTIQGMTIQTLGRITECIARLSQTARTLSFMESLLQNNSPLPKESCGDGSVNHLRDLFEGIGHSVKEMELLALSVEEKFQRIGEMVDDSNRLEKDTSHRNRSMESLSCEQTYSINTPIENSLHLKTYDLEDSLHSSDLQEFVIEERTEYGQEEHDLTDILEEKTNDGETANFISMQDGIEADAVRDLNEGVRLPNEVKTIDDPVDIQTFPPEDAKHKIEFLEDRLTSWIKEIERIDVRIEKSIETSKSLPYKRSSFDS